jgi:hypothetical protein
VLRKINPEKVNDAISSLYKVWVYTIVGDMASLLMF